jgi:hypothetical protein
MLTTTQLMCVAGVGLTAVKSFQNGGKWPRYNLDRWDKVSGMVTGDFVANSVTAK